MPLVWIFDERRIQVGLIMKISEQRKAELYSSINMQIMDVRLDIATNANSINMINVEVVDELLFKLNSNIWKEVKKTLNISE